MDDSVSRLERLCCYTQRDRTVPGSVAYCNSLTWKLTTKSSIRPVHAAYVFINMRSFPDMEKLRNSKWRSAVAVVEEQQNSPDWIDNLVK